jgi:hypothetical protein
MPAKQVVFAVALCGPGLSGSLPFLIFGKTIGLNGFFYSKKGILISQVADRNARS